MRRTLFALYLIVQWIFLSSTIILFNKYLLSERKFHFPITLVLLHMVFVSACALLWKQMGWITVPTLTWQQIRTRFVPVAVCFALSLSLGNAAYLYITVAFVQMLKALTPVVVLLASFAFGLEQPSKRLGVYIVCIATGVAVACYGQLELDVVGVALQLGAVACESIRLCLININLTSQGIKLPPIAFLYFVAPLCALALLPAWLYCEAALVTRHHLHAVRRVGVGVLALNASVAFVLNLATMALIKHTSALTLNVSGVFKDLLLIFWSVMVSGATVTPVQYFGYALALAGVTGYSNLKRAQQQEKQKVEGQGAASVEAERLRVQETAASPAESECLEEERAGEKQPLSGASKEEP